MPNLNLRIVKEASTKFISLMNLVLAFNLFRLY